MILKLTKNKLFLGILVFLLFVNLLVIFNFNYFYVQAIFSFIFLITIPGLLIMLMFKIREIGFWEYLVYTIGLSVAFLMFAGLLVNWTLPLLGIDNPLSLNPLLICFDIFLLIFLLIAYKRNEEISLEIKSPKLDWLNQIFFIIPMVFPALSILGALTLNNNGPNHLTMIMLAGIAVYVFFAVLFRNKLNENVYPFAIFLISISLLLMFSLRSWHISGWDIHGEYQVFQLTQQNFHWSMLNSPISAYNACLSITILPTIFSWFLEINDEYVFKLLFPLIFSFVPVGVYLFLRRYTKNIFAFIAVFFFMSQFQFMQQMPALARQEIAFLFFTLCLLILFNKNVNPTLRNLLFLIFGFSMVVSHYSTTYIALGLFGFTYLICHIFRKTENKKYFSKIYEKFNLKEKGGEIKEIKYYLSATLIILFLAFTFLWYSQITKTSENLIDLIHKTTQNMGKIFTSEMRSEGAKFALWGTGYGYTVKEVQNYVQDVSIDYHTNKTWINFNKPETYNDYNAMPVFAESVPVINPKIQTIVGYITEMAKKSIKVFILISVFYLLFFQLKKRKINAEYIIMTLGFLFLLGIIIFVPYVSTGYNLERLYQQSLVILSLPVVLGGLVAFKFLKENRRIALISLILILYFLSYAGSGFLPVIIGGKVSMNFINFGEDFDRFYTHNSEVKSAEWLEIHYNGKNLIYADNYAKLRLWSFAKIHTNILEDILPSTIDKNAYVYSSYTNTLGQRTFAHGRSLSYNFPTEFLNQNKNKIYNNVGSGIFK